MYLEHFLKIEKWKQFARYEKYKRSSLTRALTIRVLCSSRRNLQRFLFHGARFLEYVIKNYELFIASLGLYSAGRSDMSSTYWLRDVICGQNIGIFLQNTILVRVRKRNYVMNICSMHMIFSSASRKFTKNVMHFNIYTMKQIR